MGRIYIQRRMTGLWNLDQIPVPQQDEVSQAFMIKQVHFPGSSKQVVCWDEFLAGQFPHASELSTGISLRHFEFAAGGLAVLPHAGMHPDLPKLFDIYLKSLPDDWDVLTLGAYFGSPPTHCAGHIFRPTEFSLIHGLALGDRASAVLRNAPAGNALEEVVNSHIREGSLNVYSVWPNLIVPTAERFNSFRQIGQHGRTGNQFFQVAATIGAAVRHGYRPQFPGWKTSEILSEHFDQRLELQRISGVYNEPHFHYAPIPDTPDLDLFGFFQSPRYFAGYEDLIRQYFRPSPRLGDAINSRFAGLLSKPTVGLHVRRADYVGLSHAFVPLPVEYYRAAMRLFPSDSHFVAFSDDPGWCREAFKNDGVEVMSGNPGYADLYLMASCKHQIIANSSFSWWAAYLNANPEKRVVAPKTWFGPALGQNDTRDLLPGEWVTI
jgi:hypothetical protein